MSRREGGQERACRGEYAVKTAASGREMGTVAGEAMFGQ